MDMASDQPVGILLQQWRTGRKEALDQLMPLVYDELHRLAKRFMASETPGSTLRSTALVHEAYLRLVDTEAPWQDRAHFLALAARMMRRIIVDHARARSTAKRGGGGPRVTLDEGLIAADSPDDELLALDEALDRLATFDARKAKIIELVYFGGLNQTEAAEVQEISVATVERELRAAKAWLFSELSAD